MIYSNLYIILFVICAHKFYAKMCMDLKKIVLAQIYATCIK